MTIGSKTSGIRGRTAVLRDDASDELRKEVAERIPAQAADWLKRMHSRFGRAHAIWVKW